MVKSSFGLAVSIGALCCASAACSSSDSVVPVMHRADAAAPAERDSPDRTAPPPPNDEPVAAAATDAGAEPQEMPEMRAEGAGHSAQSVPKPPLAGRAAADGGNGGAGAGAGGANGSAGRSVEAAGSGAGGAGAGVCPVKYSVATHIVINVSWVSSLALTAGEGQVHVWSKSRFVERDDGATVESRSCGSVLPVITTSAIAGSHKILPDIPDAAWDSPNMPTFKGTAVHNGDTLTVNPGIALIGLSLDVPAGPWPAVSAVTGVDHDGDGQLGVTAIPRDGGEFVPPPTSIAQITRADQLYLAIRNIMTLTATAPGCPDSFAGTADVTSFDSHIIGCHVKGGGACTTSQRDFVDSNRTIYNVNNSTFTSQRVDDALTCDEVRSLMPIQ